MRVTLSGASRESVGDGHRRLPAPTHDHDRAAGYEINEIAEKWAVDMLGIVLRGETNPAASEP